VFFFYLEWLDCVIHLRQPLQVLLPPGARPAFLPVTGPGASLPSHPLASDDRLVPFGRPTFFQHAYPSVFLKIRPPWLKLSLKDIDSVLSFLSLTSRRVLFISLLCPFLFLIPCNHVGLFSSPPATQIFFSISCIVIPASGFYEAFSPFPLAIRIYFFS